MAVLDHPPRSGRARSVRCVVACPDRGSLALGDPPALARATSAISNQAGPVVPGRAVVRSPRWPDPLKSHLEHPCWPPPTAAAAMSTFLQLSDSSIAEGLAHEAIEPTIASVWHSTGAGSPARVIPWSPSESLAPRAAHRQSSRARDARFPCRAGRRVGVRMPAAHVNGVQRCLRGVLCPNLLIMRPRERKRCGPLVGSHLRRVARDTRARPRRNAAARLARLRVATSTEAGYLPETEVV